MSGDIMPIVLGGMRGGLRGGEMRGGIRCPQVITQ